MRLVKPALALGTALLLGAQALAQSPPPAAPAAGGTPEQMPFATPYGTPITVERATQVVNAVIAEARKHPTWRFCISVVDPNGDLVAFHRMDGAQIASIVVSQAKARTATRYRRETRLFYNAFESGHGYVATLDPTLVASPGGYPLVEGGRIIGAVGCSGGTGDQDANVCAAGAAAVK